jgi:lysyl-tRNA synthetase class 2
VSAVDSKQWRSKASNEVLLKRALMLKSIRAFFDARDVIEVETPLLSRYSSTDPHLDSLPCSFRGRTYYLNTSPEYAMKRLLAGGQQAIFQICKAFRDDVLDVTHNTEFTLLEWYRPGFDMSQLMDELALLIDKLWQTLAVDDTATGIKIERLSYQQAFENTIGLNPHKVSSEQCYQYAKANSVEIPQGLSADDDVNEWLDWLLTQVVAPGFCRHGFTFLYDYPAAQCSLAKIMMDGQQQAVAKRFELFFGELELANGFWELTDAKEQLLRFQRENEKRQKSGKQKAIIDEHLIAALKHGLPECSGVAVGLDRLLMVMLDIKHIEQVLSFAGDDF